MSDIRHNLTTRAGDSFTRVISWSDEYGNPRNLSGTIIEWSLKRRNEVRQWINLPQAIATNAAEGEITIHLTHLETRELRAISRNWWYEITVEFPAVRTTILEGILSIDRELVE